MQTIQALRRSIDSAENLQSIVSTMKAHASTNITQFQHAAQASMEYRNVLDMALYVVLTKEEVNNSPQISEDGSTIHMVFGSDHGLAGRFNEKMISYALEHIPQGKDHIVVAIGHQIISRLENDMDIAFSFSIAQTVGGITSLVQRLLFTIDQLKDERNIQSVILYYNKPMDRAAFEEQKEMLFPINLKKLLIESKPWKSKSIPTYYVEEQKLFSDLIQQYFFITLYRTICYSLASENASRLSSMESAEKNIGERLNELGMKYRRERQNSITEEINDVISGFKAIKKSKALEEE